MLEKLTLTNFQAHKSFTLEFDKSITTVVGRSDSGKTSLFRALRLVALNKPAGDAFIKHGEDTTSVQLEVDGHTITREKGKKNLYKLDDQSYTAFGQSTVPESIAKLLNLDELNFQRQFDPPFWLSLSPGEVSRELNEIINLGLIDKTLGEIASRLRKAKSTTEVTKDRLETARKERSELSWVKEAKVEFDKCTALQYSLEETRGQRIRLASILLDVQERKKEHQNATDASLALGNVLAVGKKALELATKAKSLRQLLTDIKNSNTLAQMKLPTKELKELGLLSDNVQSIRQKKNRLKSLLEECKAAEELKCQTKKKFQAVEVELQNEWGKNCPLCGTPKKML